MLGLVFLAEQALAESNSATTNTHLPAPPALLQLIMLPTQEWHVVTPPEGFDAAWIDRDGDLFSLSHRDAPSNMPDPTDNFTQLVDTVRAELTDSHLSLVEAGSLSVGQLRCGLYIGKTPPRERAFTYVAILQIPTHKADYWIGITCHETGTTGMRESFVCLVDASTTKTRSDTNWVPDCLRKRDPYDSRHDGDALFTSSDLRQYDELAPAHPLTRARRKISQLAAQTEIAPSVLSNALYKNTNEKAQQGAEPYKKIRGGFF